MSRSKKKDKKAQKGNNKGAFKEERQNAQPQVPATTTNLQQEAGTTNVGKTDNWGKASTLGRWAGVLTWCIDKGAEAWEKMKGFNLPDNWSDLPG
jgi:hypothetical protein